MTKVLSAVPGLRPISILKADNNSQWTVVSEKELQVDLKRMSILITNHAKFIWTTYATKIAPHVTALGTKAIPYKRDFIRKTCNINEPLPFQSGMLIGNMREIAEHKVLTESEAYIRNPNPHKQMFKFNKNIDLSTTNNQLSTIAYDRIENTITVWMRVMKNHYSLVFHPPVYLKKHNTVDFSKPRIRLTKSGSFVFDFTANSVATPRKGKLKVGVDLGHVEPLFAVVTTAEGASIAQYKSSLRVKKAWVKHDAFYDLIKNLKKKIANRTSLGLESLVLKAELALVTARQANLKVDLTKQQASEMAGKLEKHDVAVVNVEDLRFLAGSKGKSGRGGKWSYARQQVALEHSVSRLGVRMKRIIAAYSSVKCCKCSSKTSERGRLLWCSECQSLIDRDYNAGYNLSTKNHLRKNPVKLV
jgi:transposase